MLLAKNNNRLVLARADLKADGDYTCPGCQQPVILRCGKHKVPHFAHQKNALCGFSEGETREHLCGKKQIYEWAASQGWQPQLEVYLPEIMQRPDLLLIVNGKRVAIEFQCSPLSLERLLERNAGYRRLNIKVWWILGPPYQRRLGPQKIVQFTQVVGQQLVLLFWDLHQQRLVIRSDYATCSFSRAKFNRQLILTQQINALQKQQFRHPIPKLQAIATKVYHENGHILAQCPLVCHDLSPSWPSMVQPVILWRIGVILKLKDFPLFYVWSIAAWESFLFAVGKGDWIKTGCVTTSLLSQMSVQTYTAELKRAGVIAIFQRRIVLFHRPQWVEDPQSKLISQKQQRSA